MQIVEYNLHEMSKPISYKKKKGRKISSVAEIVQRVVKVSELFKGKANKFYSFCAEGYSSYIRQVVFSSLGAAPQFPLEILLIMNTHNIGFCG